ncbi:MAG TPA: hypothetical protein VFX21_04485 [Acidimicrobiia bacterium]|nr:hypothetical protein [Acidimicrobiia bacterium]
MKLAALAAVAVLAFAGCGGDDDDSSGGGGGSDDTVSEAEFQKQANALCVKFNDEVDAKSEELNSSLDENSTPEDIANVFIDEILPLFRDQVQELQDLPTPDANAEQYDELFDDLESAADDLEQQAKDDPEKLFSSEEDPFADLDQRARDLGLDDCGSTDE